jgi:hypothetical protein
MKNHWNRFAAKTHSTRNTSRRSGVLAKRFTLAAAEELEPRTLLTVDALGTSALYGSADLSLRCMLASNATHINVQATQATSAAPTSTPVATTPSASALAAVSKATSQVTTLEDSSNSGDGLGATSAVTPLAELVSPQDANTIVEFSLVAEDTSGNPISVVSAGQDFKLAAFVQDVRNPENANPGVFSAWLNVAYNPAAVSIDPSATIDHAAFTLSATGDISTAGAIGEIGGGQAVLVSPGTNAKQLLWTVPAHALAAINPETFTTSFDSISGHDTTVFALSEQLSGDQLQFDPLNLAIVPGATPEVTVNNDVSLPEGNTGTTPFVFTVGITNAGTEPVMVNYSTADGTATAANNDYVPTSGTLTFAAGTTQLTQLVTVLVNGNTINEADETFTLNVTSPVNASLGVKVSGTGTIQNDDPAPVLSVNSVSQAEGNSGTTPMVFTVTMSAPSEQEVTVQYATADDTATQADNDYQVTSGTLTFAAGTSQLTQLVTVLVNGDTNVEPNEDFHLVLSSPTIATIDPNAGTGVGTILNDDGPNLSFSAVPALPEGNSGTTDFVFTVSVGSVSPTSDVTVEYATQDGTATTADSDYVPTSGTLTFTAGTTTLTQPVTVVVNGDTKFEADETFSVVLSNATNASVFQSTGTATIQNDDTAPTVGLTSSTTSAPEGNSGQSFMLFTVNLSAVSGLDATVAYQTTDGTATTADSDYVATSGTLTFLAGSTGPQVISVAIIGDTKFENDETFTLNLTSPTNATLGTIPSATGTIQNDDTAPSITLAPVSQNEGNSGTTNFVFTATLSAASGLDTTVAYSTTDGTATTADSDYVATSGTLTIPAGSTSGAITVLVNGNTVNEANETFTLNLASPVNATLTNATATGTIVNDDPLPTVLVSSVSNPEGNSGTTNFVFTVSLSAASGQEIDVAYATADGTATTADNDYIATSGTLTFLAGDTSHTVTVAVIGNTTNEADETFTLNLTPVTLQVNTASATGTIVNDDPVPSLAVEDVQNPEGNVGLTPFVFPVTLNAVSGQTVTVAYATADGTATTAKNDYQATSGVLTFAPGTIAQNVTVQVVGNTILEPDETFLVNFSSPTNASLPTTQATGTIQNDDVTTPSSLSGTAFIDVDNSTTLNNGEQVLANLSVTLTGTTAAGTPVSTQVTTAADGTYTFSNLDPGTYTVSFAQPDGGFSPGTAKVGTEGGTASGNTFTTTIASPGGVTGTNNMFFVLGQDSGHVSQRSFLASSLGAASAAASTTSTATTQVVPNVSSAAVQAATDAALQQEHSWLHL